MLSAPQPKTLSWLCVCLLALVWLSACQLPAQLPELEPSVWDTPVAATRSESIAPGQPTSSVSRQHGWESLQLPASPTTHASQVQASCDSSGQQIDVRKSVGTLRQRTSSDRLRRYDENHAVHQTAHQIDRTPDYYRTQSPTPSAAIEAVSAAAERTSTAATAAVVVNQARIAMDQDDSDRTTDPAPAPAPVPPEASDVANALNVTTLRIVDEPDPLQRPEVPSSTPVPIVNVADVPRPVERVAIQGLQPPVDSPPIPRPIDGPFRDDPLVPTPIRPDSFPIGDRLDEPIEELTIQGTVLDGLKLLADQADVTIVPSPGISQLPNLDIKFESASFREMLEALATSANLEVVEKGNLIFVYTSVEYDQIELSQTDQEMRIYKLNYISAQDLILMISPFVTPTGLISATPPSGVGIASNSASANAAGVGGGAAPAGDIGGGGAGDDLGGGGGAGAAQGVGIGGGAGAGGGTTGGNSLAASDTVIVFESPENLERIDRIVAELDVQPFQVLIEAVVMSVDLNDDQELGVNFGLVDDMAETGLVAGNGLLLNAAAGFTPAQVLSTATQPIAGLREGTFIPGFLSSDQGLKFGFIDENVTGFIRALEVNNRINILASPRILVLNKQPAEIQLGQRLGFRNTVTNLTSSLETVQFLSVGTLLNLRPYVSNDGMVRLEIHPEQSTGTIDAEGVPQTNTTELTTNILVPDGATIVIGGLIDESRSLAQQGLPGLSRLPILGPLFRLRLLSQRKQELIVLLTPRILRRSSLPQPQPGLPPKTYNGVPNGGPMPGPGFNMAAGPNPQQIASGLIQKTNATPYNFPLPVTDGYSIHNHPRYQHPEHHASTTPAGPESVITSYAPQNGPLGQPITPDPSAPVPIPNNPQGTGPVQSSFQNSPELDGVSGEPRSPQPFPEIGSAWQNTPWTTMTANGPMLDRQVMPTSGSSAGTTNAVEYVVTSRDSWASIAKRAYGDPRWAEALWQANRDRYPTPHHLAPGQRLRIPAQLSVMPQSMPELRGTGSKFSWPWDFRRDRQSRR